MKIEGKFTFSEDRGQISFKKSFKKPSRWCPNPVTRQAYPDEIQGLLEEI